MAVPDDFFEASLPPIALVSRMSRDGSDLPLVSVIIPVYNDHESLRACLSSLSQQRHVRDNWEVVVVDNRSSPPIAETFQGIAQGLERVRLYTESTPGSYAARNRGITEARGSLLAFTDADCRPSPTWLSAGRDHMVRTGSDLAGGRIEMTFRGQRPNPWEYFDMATFLDQEKYVSQHDFGATANLFVRRDAIEQYGRFRSDLKSSGDAEFCQRLVKQGASITYAEAACVRHPARHTLGGLVRKLDRIDQGKRDLSTGNGETHKDALPSFRRLLPPRTLPEVDNVDVSGAYGWRIRLGYTVIRWYSFARDIYRSTTSK